MRTCTANNLSHHRALPPACLLSWTRVNFAVMPAVQTGMINVARHFCSHIGTVSQALTAAMSQAHRRHMRTRLKQNHHFCNLKQTRGSSAWLVHNQLSPCISNCIFLHKVKLSVSSAWWPLTCNGGDSKRRTLDRMTKRWPWPLCRDLTYNNLFNFYNQDFVYWFMLNRGRLRVAAFEIGSG